MQRVPLGELPLEPFLAYEDPIGTKRPHSRGTPTPFSPAKRRILSEEGIFVVQKSHKTPLPSAQKLLQTPSRFSQVLAGSGSPARVLDFGLPKSFGGDPEKPSSSYRMDVDSTPRKAPASSSSRQLVPSPELKATRRRSPRLNKDLTPAQDNPFESPTPATTSKAATTKRSTKKATRKVKETLVPRVPPPISAPDSIHYPGFQVYQDPYNIEYTQETAESSSDMEVDDELEDKENVKPRRICVKGATLTEGLKTNKGKGTSPDSTPKKATAPSTPASTRFSRLANRLSLSSVPQTSKKALRQALHDELDLGAEADSD